MSVNEKGAYQSGACDAVAILGIPIDKTRLAGAIERIEQMIRDRKPRYLATVNVDFVTQARSDIELRRILLAAHLVLCDGAPLVWASRLLGNPIPERITGADLVPHLIRMAEEKSYRVFFLGGAARTCRRAVERVKCRHPKLEIAWYSPPFGKLLEMDHDEIRRRIAEARPDMLFVCFGCPKQEKWIAMHYRELGVPVAVGVGATVDFLAEQVKRAPLWMQRNGIEWFYRLLQEPRRLAGRYARDFRVFGPALLRQCLVERRRHNDASPAQANLVLEGAWRYARLPELFVVGAYPPDLFAPDGLLPDTCVLLDAGGVVRMDATALASLLRWQTAIRNAGSTLLLLNPSRAVRAVLDFARLTDLFDIAPDMDAARSWMLERLDNENVSVRHQSTATGFRLVWRGEITAANAESYWTATSAILQERASQGEAISEIGLNLKGVSFIDSTGLGVLIRLRKLTQQTGVRLLLEEPHAAVLNVIRLAQLENFLLSNEPAPRRFHLPRFPLLEGVLGRAT